MKQKSICLILLFTIIVSIYLPLEAKASSSTKLLWPVPSSSVMTAGYGDGRNHWAIDIAAPRDTPVVASASGYVIFVDTRCTHTEGKDYNCCIAMGKYVKIQHMDKINGKTVVSRYSHLHSVNVKNGDYVRAGQKIGGVGSTGYSTGYHLDYKLYFDNVVVDPGDYLQIPYDLHYSGRKWTINGPYVQSLKNKAQAGIGSSVLEAVPGYTYPISLKPKTSFTISGTVRSNYRISSVTAGIYDTNGSPKYTATKYPNAMNYSLSNVDSALKFNYLPEGTYVYQVNATDTSMQTAKNIIYKVFTVSSSSTLSAVPGFTAPASLEPGQAIPLKGIVASNFNILSITAGIYTSSGSKVYEALSKPNAPVFYIESICNSMTIAALPEGSYIYRVIAVDNSGVGWKAVINQPFVISSKTIIEGDVSISGWLQMVGRTLTADVSCVMPENAKLSYQWKLDGVNISGAVNNTYTPKSSDAGKLLTLEVTGLGSFVGSIESPPVRPLPSVLDVLPGNYRVDFRTFTVSPVACGTTVKQLIDGMLEGFLYSGVYNGSTKLNESDSLATGLLLKPFVGFRDFAIVVKCDVDSDGKATASDARLALRSAAGLEELTNAQLRAADYDENGVVMASDAREILRIAAKL